ncbi:MAG: dTDP-4-dehydrorhamnose reductase [Flavobacteriaceae bacterium]|nr:dTDP-4-dehydrorhamnose reductase [Flavobacteriaceae bacterium]
MYSKSSILVTGANGQLGQALKKNIQSPNSFFYTDSSSFDITNQEQMTLVFEKLKPAVIINTAAYTQVDQAETEIEQAYKLNVEAVKNLSAFCIKYNCALIHISTDYVFDGKQLTPYKETDAPSPVTVYGKSKREGELAILESGLQRFAIIRTSWLYSEFGNNFYKTMLRLVETKTDLNVVDDQRGSPTNANELAKALLVIASKLSSENSGVYHYCNDGETTWYGFAKAIFKKHKLSVKVNPVSSNEFPTAAKRPAYSVLDTSKIKRVFDIEIPSWVEAFEKI